VQQRPRLVPEASWPSQPEWQSQSTPSASSTASAAAVPQQPPWQSQPSPQYAPMMPTAGQQQQSWQPPMATAVPPSQMTPWQYTNVPVSQPSG
jgi:hypothetical protein